jgi:hypothetical protein
MVMNPWRWVDPRVRSVRLGGVRAYLLGRGWAPKPNPNANLLRFERPAEENGKPVFTMVPASDELSDFAQSITYLITTLSDLEDRHPVEVLEDILRQQGEDAEGPKTPAQAERARR